MSNVKCEITGDGGCPWIDYLECSDCCSEQTPLLDSSRKEEYHGLKLPMTPRAVEYNCKIGACPMLEDCNAGCTWASAERGDPEAINAVMRYLTEEATYSTKLKAMPFPEVTLPGIPSDRATRKATPMYGGFVAYFPDAMAAVSQLSFSANEVHNPGEPLHWSKDKSNDHKDCCVRHLAESGTYDREADNDYHYLHDVKLAWRAMANLQMVLESGKAPRIKKGEM